MIKGDIPEKFLFNVCRCDTPQGLVNSGPTPWDKHVYTVCKTCMKPPEWYLYECSYCTNVFLHDFYQNFCYKSPLCWTCNTSNEMCSEHNYCTINVSEERRIAPIYKMRKVFTDEELEGIWDFD